MLLLFTLKYQQKSRQNNYPVNFALRLMYKDFELILNQASEVAVPMPTTAVAQQICAMEHAKNIEEDYSAVIGLMEELAGLSPVKSSEKIT